jgi:hypothetical protein
MLTYRNPLLLLTDPDFHRFLCGLLITLASIVGHCYYRMITPGNQSNNPVTTRVLRWRMAAEAFRARSARDNDIEQAEIRRSFCVEACRPSEAPTDEDFARYIQQLTMELKQTRDELLHRLVETSSPLVSSSPSSGSVSTSGSGSGSGMSEHSRSREIMHQHFPTGPAVAANNTDATSSRFSPVNSNLRGALFSRSGTADSSPPASTNSISSMISLANAELITQCIENPLSGDTDDDDNLWDHHIDDMHELL